MKTNQIANKRGTLSSTQNKHAKTPNRSIFRQYLKRLSKSGRRWNKVGEDRILKPKEFYLGELAPRDRDNNQSHSNDIMRRKRVENRWWDIHINPNYFY